LAGNREIETTVDLIDMKGAVVAAVIASVAIVVCGGSHRPPNIIFVIGKTLR
jgi:hypothetical protein